MTRSKDALERARQALPPPGRDAYERLLRRRDLKQRNARIEAAILGLLIASIGIFAAVEALHRSGHPKPASSCAPMPGDLTHWWPGNGTGADLVGSLPATLHGDATFGPGLFGQAFELDGAGDFVSVPDDPGLDLGTGDFTVALWVNFNDTEVGQVLVEKWVQASFEPEIVHGWTFTMVNDAVGFAIGYPTRGSFSIVSPPLKIPVGTWVHFAVRRQGNLFQILMNGEVVRSKTASERPVLDLDSSSSLKFGHRGDPEDTPGSVSHQESFLNGRIDDVKLVVGRAMSDMEITAMVDARSSGRSC